MTTSKAIRALRFVTSATSALAVTALVAACSLNQANSTLAQGAGWQQTCPSGKQVAAEIAIDVSGSHRVSGVQGQFEQALRDRASRAAMCGGHLRVEAFSGSDAGTLPMFDGTLGVIGSTTNAKARRVPDAVDGVLSAVQKQFPLDTSRLTPGSDVVGQLWNGQQYVAQLGAGYVLDLVIQTDGLDNMTVSTDQITNVTDARDEADEVTVPDLSGAWVTITGLGETGGQPVDSSVTAALTAFYSEVCKRTNAAKCTIAIDYTSPVGG